MNIEIEIARNKFGRDRGNVSPIFEHRKMHQNRKILRYRACLAQVAVVCVNLKHLNGELLSYKFCQFFKENVKSLNRIRYSIQMEIRKQSAAGWVGKDMQKWTAFNRNPQALLNQRSTTLRSRILSILHAFCEVLLSELHALNYEHISDTGYDVLGKLMDIYGHLRHEVIKEQNLQTQCKPDRILQKVS